MHLARAHVVLTGHECNVLRSLDLVESDKQQSFNESSTSLQVFGGTGSFQGTSGTFTVGRAAAGRRMASWAAQMWARVYTNVLGF